MRNQSEHVRDDAGMVGNDRFSAMWQVMNRRSSEAGVTPGGCTYNCIAWFDTHVSFE